VIGNPDRYAIPFRCLTTLNVDNLLIVGRSASFSSLAASSARVVPLGMACGQAAGPAAALSRGEDLDFRVMSRDEETIARLQAQLKAQGAYLEDFSIDEPFMSHWAYKGMAALRRLGLMSGGYDNDYRLDEHITKQHFLYLLNGVVEKSGIDLYEYKFSGPINNKSVIDGVAAVYLSVNGNNDHNGITLNEQGRSHMDKLGMLSGAGILSAELIVHFMEEDVAPHIAEVVMLLFFLISDSFLI